VSDAVHVTVVVPTGNNVPEAGTQVTGRARSTRSNASGDVQLTKAPVGPEAGTVMFAGTLVIAGGVVSTIRTSKVADGDRAGGVDGEGAP
jgi:hypothetical protein